MIDAPVMLAALKVLASGGLSRYSIGGVSEVSSFESELREMCEVRHALAVNSGTSALICGLVGAGIGPGDEVLVPAYTWVSTAAAPLAAGAVPVLVDVDRSMTIDPEDIERKITPRTRAILPVHMINVPCNMDAIMAIAARHDLTVIEDACQAVGVRYKGRRLGSIGHAGAFSFNQHKNIKAGEGGALLTSDHRLYARAAMYHDVGSYSRSEKLETEEPLFVGQNLRMPELAGAILRPQLRRLDRMLAARRRRRQFVVRQLEALEVDCCELSPHHDPDNAVGLTLHFDSPEKALACATARGINRLADTGRHVYSNWQSILEGRTAHPKLNPYQFVPGATRITAEASARTLEILENTCSVSLMPELPYPAYCAAIKYGLQQGLTRAAAA
jgi:dTDP-4-amino-4,6-dideoxygalactose transaminase